MSSDNNLENLNTNIDILIWSVITLLSFLIIGYSIVSFISSFTLAIFFYYSTRPLYRYLDQFEWLKNNTWRSITTITIGVLPLTLLIGYTVAVLVSESRSLVVKYDVKLLNEYLPSIFTKDFITVLQQPFILLENSNGIDTQFVSQLLEWGTLTASFLSEAILHILLTSFILFYLLRDDHKMGNWVHEHMSIVTPMWTRLWEYIDEDLHAVFYGNILNMFFTGFISILLFILYNFIAPENILIKFPFLFGALAGLSSLLPIVGTKLIYIPLSSYFALTSYLRGELALLPVVFIFSALAFVFIDFIPDMILRPYLSSQRIHPGIILFGYIAGASVIGWYGFFLAPIIIIFIYNFLITIFPRLLYTIFQNRI